MAQIALRRKTAGGWWNGDLGSLGQSGETEFEGSGLPTDPVEIEPPYYGEELSPDDPVLHGEGSAEWSLQHPTSIMPENTGGFVGPFPIGTAAQIAAMIAALAQTGIKAFAPNPSTGACPAGYRQVAGGACIPSTAVAPAASASILPGVPNSTLFMIAGGFLFLMVLSGGRKR